jgi:predicted small lipoprotein YifL
MFFRSTSLILSVALIAGCGRSGPRTYPVSGTVSMDGQPLATGKIFLIDPETHLDADVGDIVDGQFEFRAQAGAKRVELRAERKTGQQSHFGGEVTEEALPARYNSESELTVEVTQDGDENEFAFDLQSGT